MGTVLRSLLLIWALCCGCRRGEKAFPYQVPDRSYSNGHPLVLNTPDDKVVAWEQDLVDLTNIRRAENGLAPLSRSPMLDGLARAHSAHMVIHGFYGHDNPEGDSPNGRLMRVARSGYLYENLWFVLATDSPAFILEGFWNSPEHRAAILSSTDLIGVGMVRTPNPVPEWADQVHVTMEFLRSK